MNVNADAQKFPWKKIMVVFVVLLALSGLAVGGWMIHQKISNRPLTPLESKQLVAKYLEEKTGTKEFKCAIDVSKEKNVWEALKFAYDAPPDYKDVYRAMGEHLSVAETLLKGTEERQRYNGFRIIVELMQIANDVAYDPWLGARITDAYLVANFDKVEENPKRGFNREQLMHHAGRAYRNAEEDEKLIELGKMYLAQYGSGPRADDVRRRLVQTLQSKGRQKEAEIYLAQMKTSETSRKQRNEGQSK